MQGAAAMKRQAGFSVIELVIVLAIVLVLLAVVVPSLMRSRIAANEASAVGSLEVINVAQVTYASAYPEAGYAKALSNLGGSAQTCATATGATSTSSCLIDSVLGGGTKSGYTFVLVTDGDPAMPIGAYQSIATPAAVGNTGDHTFSSDQSGMIQSDLASSSSTTAAVAVRRHKSVAGATHASSASGGSGKVGKLWVFVTRK
jgi:type IV pilus assembly protein PilA